jgi:ABC-2 type transport system ATP-binding protein
MATRALLAAYPEARDLQVSGAGLEEAFVELTGDHADPNPALDGQEALL